MLDCVICVRSLIILAGYFGVTRVLVTSLCVVSDETCVPSVETYTRAFSPVRLDLMSHIISPLWLNQLSSITACNRFYDS